MAIEDMTIEIPECVPAEEKKASIFRIIHDSLRADGSLPDDFSLSDAVAAANGRISLNSGTPEGGGNADPADAEGDEMPELTVKWADGAEDGVLLYHTVRKEPDDADRRFMAEAVWEVSTGDTDKADTIFAALCELCPVPFFAETLEEYLLDNKDTISNEAVYRYALHCIAESPDKDLVKVGLSIIQLFETKDDEEICRIIRTLAVCSEFTLYAIQSMLGWTQPNEEMFALAKRVHGWGRVHAMRFLKPGGEKISRWALKEGVNNGVLPCYTSRKAWELSEAEKRLDGPLTAEEFGCISRIMDALMDEEAVNGISLLEDPKGAVRRYLHRAQSFRLSPDDYRAIDQMEKRWSDDPLIPAMCRSIKENM